MTTRPQGSRSGPHDTHDRLLVAARAAGDLAGRDLDLAERLLTSCGECRTLLEELREIAAATRHLPSASRPTDLDFRLTRDLATSLARGAWWRRSLRPFGRRGSTAVRPLAAAFMTLGLSGLLLAALPMLPFGGAGAYLAVPGGPSATRDGDPERFNLTTISPAQPTVGTLDLRAQQPAVAGTPGTPAPRAVAPEAAAPGVAGEAKRGDEPEGGGPAPLALLSLAFLAAGLGLILLRQVALRLR